MWGSCVGVRVGLGFVRWWVLGMERGAFGRGSCNYNPLRSSASAITREEHRVGWGLLREDWGGGLRVGGTVITVGDAGGGWRRRRNADLQMRPLCMLSVQHMHKRTLTLTSSLTHPSPTP